MSATLPVPSEHPIVPTTNNAIDVLPTTVTTVILQDCAQTVAIQITDNLTHQPTDVYPKTVFTMMVAIQ